MGVVRRASESPDVLDCTDQRLTVENGLVAIPTSGLAPRVNKEYCTK